MEPQQVLPFRVRMDLKEIAKKRNSSLSRSSELESNNWIQFTIIGKKLFVSREQGVNLYEVGAVSQQGGLWKDQMIWKIYLFSVPPPDKYGTMPFF